MYLLDEKQFEKFEELLKKFEICPICISRLFYNKSDINIIKFAKIIKKNFYSNRKINRCFLCNNILLKMRKIILRMIERLEFYEFKSFSVGIKIPENLAAREDYIRSMFSIASGFSLKTFFNFIVANSLSFLLKKKFDPSNPEIRIIYNALEDSIEITPSSIFIFGRYFKLKRGVRQTKQYCKFCKGTGCNECVFTGFTKDPSIEGAICDLFRDFFLGEKGILHAAGREDIDVLTLGTGRPFVIEVTRPLKRRIDLKYVEKMIKVDYLKISNLAFVDRSVMEKINVFSKFDEKTYRLILKFKDEIEEGDLMKVEKELKNKVISQRTPLRVLFRRVDKYRYKTVYDVRAKKIDDHTAEFIIRCQGGLYIKELAHGDQGRTNPSIYSIIGKPLEVLSLDVISIAPGLEKRLGLKTDGISSNAL